MRILIIEDEELAALRLENMVLEFDEKIEVVARLESVSQSIKWLLKNKTPDLIFLDIHLEDNLSFAIFEALEIRCPIVFTTATDLNSTDFFRKNKIDFLLKPIIQKELNRILEKFSIPENSGKSNFNSVLYKNMSIKNS